MFRFASAVLAVCLAVPLTATAQQATPADEEMLVLRGQHLKWETRDAPGFPPGQRVAVLAGDPGKAGPYTLRLSIPAGYRIPAHYHPNVENLTVISGRFLLGMGEKTDIRELQAYEPGDYLVIPARMAHFGRADGDTVIQLHGIGPFAITVTEQVPGAKPAN